MDSNHLLPNGMTSSIAHLDYCHMSKIFSKPIIFSLLLVLKILLIRDNQLIMQQKMSRHLTINNPNLGQKPVKQYA